MVGGSQVTEGGLPLILPHLYLFSTSKTGKKIQWSVEPILIDKPLSEYIEWKN